MRIAHVVVIPSPCRASPSSTGRGLPLVLAPRRRHASWVYPRQAVPRPLLQLAELQDGALSREQALGLGLTDHVISRLLASGTWQPLGAGIYLTSPGPVPWLAAAWGGLLVGGSRARLGPQASGHLHGLIDAPDVVDVLVPLTGPHRASGPWSFLRERPGARSSRTVGSPPRLPVEDAVLDLAAGADPTEVVRLVTRAVQRRGTRASRTAVALESRRRHPHRTLLQGLLGDVAAGAESALELSYLRDVERPHGLPRGHRQASRRGLPYASDVGYDEWHLLVELDGRLGHDDEGRFRDMWRDNQFTVRALLTLRYGWFDVVDRPCAVAAQVGTVLVQRGWSGSLTRCPRCRAATDLDLMATA